MRHLVMFHSASFASDPDPAAAGKSFHPTERSSRSARAPSGAKPETRRPKSVPGGALPLRRIDVMSLIAPRVRLERSSPPPSQVVMSNRSSRMGSAGAAGLGAAAVAGILESDFADTGAKFVWCVLTKR